MEQKTNKKALGIIITIIVILLIVAIIGGIFVFKNANSSTGTEWGDTYFERLKEDIAKENGEYSNIDDNNMEITFLQLKENSNPVMMVTYKEADKKKINIYREREYNNEDNKYIINNGMSNEENKEYDIQFLYNTELKENRWYLTTTEANSKMIDYSDIQKEFDRFDKTDDFNNITESEEEINKNSSYVFNKDELSKESIEGQETTISKFEETFVKIDEELVEELYPSFTITTDMKENEIKNEMKENIEKYNPKNEKINNEIKTATQNKVAEIENKKEQIKVAQEEKAKKEAEEKAKSEEEAKKKAEEEAKKGLKVGNYTLKYGTYVGYDIQYDPSGETKEKITMKINSNGTYTYNGANGTYTVKSNQIIGTNGMPMTVTGNNKLEIQVGAGITMTYQGN